MTIESIAAITPETISPQLAANPEVGPNSFADLIRGELHSINSEIVVADEGVRQLAVGDPVNLHQVMINLERAKLHFDLVLQVRNKLMDAYQDVMRMQI